MRIIMIGGTRPDWLKLYPVYKKLEKTNIQIVLIDTGQGRDFTKQVFSHLEFEPDYELDCMRDNQDLSSFLEIAMSSIREISFRNTFPDFIMVQGDTMSALAGALVAKDLSLGLIHLEAGIRSYDILNPFPEEMIRIMIDSMSDILFAPTDFTKANLNKSGIIKNVFITGNTIIDLLKMKKVVKREQGDRKRILVTIHRRDNFGKPLVRICSAIKSLARKYKDEIEFVIPVHWNPNIKEVINLELRGKEPDIILEPPLDYWEFLSLMKSCWIICTDSGGVSEEACSFGIPVLILREITDRQESVNAGFSKIVGTNKSSIMSAIDELLLYEDQYEGMKALWNPFGDGKASKKIVGILKTFKKETFNVK